MTDPIPAWPGEPLTAGSGQVFVRRAPAAPGAEPAVLVHGLGGSSTNWTDLMDLLRRPPADGASGPALACEAPDLPGFGFSPAPAGGNYSVDAHAAAVIDLIETRVTWPVHLFGNSLGGAVATRVAGRRPDLVRTLTLVSPALPDLWPRALPLRVTSVGVPGFGPWLMGRARAFSPEQRALATLGEVYAEPGRMHPARQREEIAEVARRDQVGYADQAMIGSVRGIVAEYIRAGRGSLWGDAARVTAPTLVVYGSHDRLVRPAMAGRAARAFRYARVVVLPRTGHVAMMERPALVAAEVRELLGRPAAGRLRQVPS